MSIKSIKSKPVFLTYSEYYGLNKERNKLKKDRIGLDVVIGTTSLGLILGAVLLNQVDAKIESGTVGLLTFLSRFLFAIPLHNRLEEINHTLQTDSEAKAAWQRQVNITKNVRGNITVSQTARKAGRAPKGFFSPTV